MDPAAPNSPFKWEAASGLEHSCYLCSTKMSNPKARQTCYGIHSIPCFRYHQTMHAIGTSHNCFSCIQADELHENRHRKIAELLAEYRIANGRDTAKPRTLLQDLPVNVPLIQQAIQHLDVGNDDFEVGEETDQDDEAETVTDTTTSTADENDQQHMPPTKLTKAEARALKKAAKTAKSQSKAAKNQQKHVIGVRTADVSFVAEVLHGNNAGARPGAQPRATHPLASDKTIEEVIARNMGFMSSIQEHKKALLSSIAQRRKSERERRKSSIAGISYHGAGGKKRRFSEGLHDCDAEDDEMEDLLVAVLVKLGVDGGHARSTGCTANTAVATTNGVGVKKNGVGGGINKAPASSPQQTSSIVAALKALVKDDLERFENEQRETCVRAGGFWRYVGRPVFERMTKIAREVDWKTGVKLKDINNKERDG
ncbi:hypothetical protein Z517_01589 [Fonsecaea pedrosoi CBS 271.37]|uniref:Unplaced genomic scaffold supercont1.1, whole genome shotgun sequence n=1 Tax=Fonsecaea pedrosoi CBS 271.37 TaxID=1442368 RepID=A0A0D2HP04_9EURO|nr:uncharacterized protein Z517_01589 [Fonsecaea pedrosoi CBS 271.37]KIW86194.1 hypothetical protein Z517_01589 [Fonsecaea pedrosoi CBS 271.37]